MNSDGSLQVTFVPELFLQRQAAVLDVLRRERVTRVLDVGCGSGALLACLQEPAQLAPSCAHDKRLNTETDIYLSRLDGLDIDDYSLKNAAEDLAQRVRVENGADRWSNYSRNRWNALEVNLWHGSLADVNPAFVDEFEAIVAQEVIEHLPPEVLPQFAPVLLGQYRPRVLIVTTPSFDFNERFSKPGCDSGKGFKDPTGRTNRVFRHHDHKLEFTRAEFKQYCDAEAQKYGYSVDVQCIGRAQEPDPFSSERSGDLGGASQVAVFTRLETLPARVCMPISSNPHKLLARERLAEKSLSSHRSPDDLLGGVKDTLRQLNENECTLHSLWYHTDLAPACNGDIGLLLDALELADADEWVLSWRATTTTTTTTTGAGAGPGSSATAAAVTLDSRVCWSAFVPAAAPPPQEDLYREHEWNSEGYARSRSASPSSAGSTELDGDREQQQHATPHELSGERQVSAASPDLVTPPADVLLHELGWHCSDLSSTWGSGGGGSETSAWAWNSSTLTTGGWDVETSKS